MTRSLATARGSVTGLLLIERGGVGYPLASRIFSGRDYSATLAVARNGDSTCQNNFGILLLAKLQSAAVDSRIRAHVSGRAAGEA